MAKREGPFWDMLEGRVAPPPVAQLLGWRLIEIDPEAGSIVVEFQGKPEFRNPIGKLQGGILAAMLDDTMGPALVATLAPNQFAPTLELKANYIKAADPGVFVCRAQVVHKGRTVAFLEGRLEDTDGNLVATATATARIVTMQGRGEQ